MRTSSRFLAQLNRLKIPVLAIMCAVMFFSGSPLSYAISQGSLDSIRDNTPFYDPNDVGACTQSSGPGVVTLTGDTPEDKIWNFLTAKGLSAEQAAGVMGNMQAESGFVADRFQAEGDVWNSQFYHGWGIVQWDGGRRYADPNGGVLGSLKNNQPGLVRYIDIQYDTARNPDAKLPSDVADALLSFELNYMVQESKGRPVTASGFGNNGSEWATLEQQKTVQDATVFWHNNFEVSNDTPEEVIKNRGGFAEKVYEKYVGHAPGDSSGTIPGEGSDCGPSSGSISAFQQKVLDFAWPSFHRAPFTSEKPAYAAAMAESKKKGLYTGNAGTDGTPGIDCGGFVTTLMIYSGFEPRYNSSGHGGNTQAQYDWAKKNWKDLGPASTINPADLQPGDVAINPAEHTYVWVGNIPGFGSKIASASTGGTAYERSPMADTAQQPTEPGFEWFRKN